MGRQLVVETAPPFLRPVLLPHSGIADCPYEESLACWAQVSAGLTSLEQK